MTEPESESVERAVNELRSNDIANFVMETVHSDPSEEPRTLQGEFPGTYNRAMGGALEVVEMAEEHGLDAEREYLGPIENLNGHRIDIHINGGSGDQ